MIIIFKDNNYPEQYWINISFKKKWNSNLIPFIGTPQTGYPQYPQTGVTQIPSGSQVLPGSLQFLRLLNFHLQKF